MLRNPLSKGAAAVSSPAAPFVSSMLDQMPNSVLVFIGATKDLVYANAAAEAALDLSRKSLQGHTLYDLFGENQALNHMIDEVYTGRAAAQRQELVLYSVPQLAYSAHMSMPCEAPRSWLAPYGLGTLGCAVPMAIGAKIAAPQRPVVALAGDGGWLFTVAEMATATDLGLGVVLVLWDNRGYAQIRQSFDDVDAPRMGVDVSSVDPEGIARGFGWGTTTVHSPDELTAALRTALDAGTPHMVRVVVPTSSGFH